MKKTMKISRLLAPKVSSGEMAIRNECGPTGLLMPHWVRTCRQA